MRNIHWSWIALLIAGCGGGGDEVPANPTPDTGTVVTDGEVDGAVDATPDAEPTAKGISATANVSGGASLSSPSYKLVLTVGQTAVTGKSTSYTLRGGVVGATQPH
jgi:hypothetical protein